MAKYGDIERAKELLAAKNKLEAWRDLEQAEKAALYETQTGLTGNKRNNVGKIEGYIRPFGYEPSKDVWLKVYLIDNPSDSLTPREESAETMINNLKTLLYLGSTGSTLYGTLTKPADIGASITSYTAKNDAGKLARVTMRKKGARLENRIASRVTGLLYTYTKTDSVSSAFGQNLAITGSQSLTAAAEAIKQAAKTAYPSDGYSFSFRGQGVISIEVVGT